jgi:hypothetical protein
MSGGSIWIDRVPLNLIGATTHARAELLARRARDAVQCALPDALASACGRALEDDDGYVFIDRLDVECAVGAHWTNDAIARAFAERLAQVLLRECRGQGAVMFRDRPDLIAAFLAALIDGHGFSRWWFADFGGLRHLPASAAIRTLIGNQGVAAWTALGRLTPDLLRRVASQLSAADAAHILGVVEAAEGDRIGKTEWLIEAYEVARSAASEGSARLVMALAIVGACAAEPPGALDLAALRMLEPVLAAARSGRLTTIAGEEPAVTLARWAVNAGGQAELAVLPRLAAMPIIEYVQAAGVVRREADATDGAGPGPIRYTQFGGALLLCVLVARLGWWARWQETLRRAGAADPAGLAAWAALAVASRALDSKQPGRIECDAALRHAFGVGDSPVHRHRNERRLLRQALWVVAPQTVAAQNRRLEPLLRASAHALLREFAARVPGCDGSTARYLRTQCLAMSAAVSADGTHVRLGRAPLDLLLVLSGLKRADLMMPDGRRLVVGEELP